MNFVQIEKRCQDSIHKICELLKKKEDELQNSITFYADQMLIAQQNFDIESYKKNLQEKNQAENNLLVLINDNKALLYDYNFTRELYSNYVRNFYSCYQFCINISYINEFDICIWKPVIRNCDDNRYKQNTYFSFKSNPYKINNRNTFIS